MAKLIKLTPQAPALPPRLRVAAYARVSKDTEQLMHSLSAQVSHYSDLIQHTPGWAYAGAYVDAGLTGTSASARPEFQRLIADCDAGKIEISLPKWIQSHKSETALKPLEIRHFTAFATSSAALGEGRFSVLCG